jgi:hypothetical protein
MQDDAEMRQVRGDERAHELLGDGAEVTQMPHFVIEWFLVCV